MVHILVEPTLVLLLWELYAPPAWKMWRLPLLPEVNLPDRRGFVKALENHPRVGDPPPDDPAAAAAAAGDPAAAAVDDPAATAVDDPAAVAADDPAAAAVAADDPAAIAVDDLAAAAADDPAAVDDPAVERHPILTQASL